MSEPPAPLLALFSDFGFGGPYVGQVMAVWAAQAPAVPRVELFSGAPPFDVEAGAHLLFAYSRTLPEGSVVEAVVDPGVGGPRAAVVVRADGLWFCGPDNGLFGVIVGRAQSCAAWRVEWRPEILSQTFHGRDLFAPIASHIAVHGAPPQPSAATDPQRLIGEIADPAERVILVDGFGNLITGIPAAAAEHRDRIAIAGKRIGFAPRFGACVPGSAFWYENANGLIEVAINRGNAAEQFDACVGTPVRIIT